MKTLRNILYGLFTGLALIVIMVNVIMLYAGNPHSFSVVGFFVPFFVLAGLALWAKE